MANGRRLICRPCRNRRTTEYRRRKSGPLRIGRLCPNQEKPGRLTYTVVTYCGVKYPSLIDLLRTIGREDVHLMVYHRLRRGWTIEQALAVPRCDRAAAGTGGTVYKIVRQWDGAVYIGVTRRSLAVRWSHHVSAALSGRSSSRLGESIRDLGPAAFQIEAIEEDVEVARLSAREAYWVLAFDALGPRGLNTARAGALGGRRGQPIVHGGETYPSLHAAANAIRASGKSRLSTDRIVAYLKSGKSVPYGREYRRVAPWPRYRNR
jgi:hypothetical protein